MVGGAKTDGTMTIKHQILERIRRAVPDYSSMRESQYEAITRNYRQSGDLDESGRIELFTDRLRDYGAKVYRCAPWELRSVIGEILSERRKRGLVIARDLPEDWLPEGFEFVRDKGLTYGEIDASEGVLTGCALAIAMTGTIVLYHSGGEGRRALTLIPDYHLCVVYTSQIVETVPEGIRALAPYSVAPLTTISGPSATADIEMTRIQGVHGPRTLDIILVKA
jgi:L-lactate dehydrogenase complex protein LldG